MSADRFDDLARFAAAAEGAEPERWPAEAERFAARHGAPLGRELLRFLSLFWGLPRALRALDLAAAALAAAGAEPAPAKASGARAAGGARFAEVYGEDAPRVLARLSELDPELCAWVLEHAYGRGYAGAGLGLAERERLAVLALAASGCWKQCDSHLRACRRLGIGAERLLADAAAGGWLDVRQRDALRARLAEVGT